MSVLARMQGRGRGPARANPRTRPAAPPPPPAAPPLRQTARVLQNAATRTVKKPQSFPARKWEAFCLNWLPYLWRARDTLLRRRVEPPKH